MVNPPAPSSVASDGARSTGGPWRQALDGRFVWVAPLPSPAKVSKLEQLFPDIIQVPVQSQENEAIVREFHRAGVSGEIEAISLANRHYIFHFSVSQAKDLVLRRPWVANGQVIAVAEWQPEFIPVADSLLQALLWIRLPHLSMEFWTKEILSSILSVAGDFLYADDSTKARKRGGFARACVRVDLGHPLWSGARVRGIGAPFWQQFSYENIEGICAHCGSLHFVGSCILSVDQRSSSAGPRFGPWMAALR